MLYICYSCYVLWHAPRRCCIGALLCAVACPRGCCIPALHWTMQAQHDSTQHWALYIYDVGLIHVFFDDFFAQNGKTYSAPACAIMLRTKPRSTEALPTEPRSSMNRAAFRTQHYCTSRGRIGFPNIFKNNPKNNCKKIKYI